MPEKYTYAAIFRSPMVQGPTSDTVVGDTTVKNIVGPASFEVGLQISRTHTIGRAGAAFTPGTLNIPHGERFIAVLTEKEAFSGPDALKTFEDEIDAVITQMSILYQPQIFFEQVYRGPILGKSKSFGKICVRPAELMPILNDELRESLLSMNKELSKHDGMEARFRNMSRFYSRALAFDPSEERFLLLWTVLELFPMQGTSNIKPINEMLAEITGRPIDEIKKVLQIGRMHGIRSDLAHDGKLELGTEQSVEIFRKLELVVHEALKYLLGLPYSGALDRYFHPTTN